MNQKLKKGDTGSSATGEIEFERIQLGVVPQFNTMIGVENSTDEVVADSMAGMNFSETNLSEEDLHEFVVMLLELPSIIWGEHLLRTDAQAKRFSHQVFIYCEKKGIDPQEYLFDEFGLVFSGAVLIQGMRKDHAEWKKSEGIPSKKKKAFNKKELMIEDEEIQDDPRQTIGGKYEPVKVKPQPRDAGSGGDNLPESKSEEPKSAEDDGAIDYSDEEITDNTVVRGGMPID